MTSRLFDKILIATDGSERNRPAIDEALRIGRACGSTVIAVFVIETSALESAAGAGVGTDTWTLMQSEAASSLAHVKSQAQGVSLETAVLEGKPATEILKFANEQGVDLIVLGTQGKRGIERFLLGSVAETVIRSAPCRVLVVK
jgi:nucleotide-binding universal stress UspA family protein